jgi:hypothetical protein
MLVNGTLPSENQIYYKMNWEFLRKDSAYGNVEGTAGGMISNTSATDLALASQIAE